jgi:transcriptional regulator with XRE-family HTH domain
MWQHRPVTQLREPDDGEVGPRLRQLREQKGLSARQVAGLAGVTPAYLSRLENGRVSPTVASLARLVAAMGETMATLFQEPPGPRETVVRRSDRHLMRSRGVLDSQVTPGWTTRLEILESLVEPGQGSSDSLHTHAGELGHLPRGHRLLLAQLTQTRPDVTVPGGRCDVHGHGDSPSRCPVVDRADCGDCVD